MKTIVFALGMIICAVLCAWLINLLGIDGDCTVALHAYAYVAIYREICDMRKGGSK